jgi:hypothetical protein
MMSSLLLGMVLSVCTCLFHNMVMVIIIIIIIIIIVYCLSVLDCRYHERRQGVIVIVVHLGATLKEHPNGSSLSSAVMVHTCGDSLCITSHSACLSDGSHNSASCSQIQHNSATHFSHVDQNSRSKY